MINMPTEMNNETYLTADESAELLGYSRSWFDRVIVPQNHLKKYQKGLKKKPILYKESDIEALAGIRPMEEPPQPPEK